MTAAPESAETWKAQLLRGECDPRVARRVGEILRALVRGTSGSRTLTDRFGDIAVFDQLRLDAYYRFTASRHPDLAAPLEALIADCEANRLALVHGDFSPKNFLVSGEDVAAIDWECVHYGNPAFDAAFLLNHLLLKSFHMPELAAEFISLARVFRDALAGAIEERSVARHLAGLLLARMDGKSPVEYIKGPALKESIRLFARSLFANPASDMEDVLTRRVAWR
jgi:5-methylthioribose kinase